MQDAVGRGKGAVAAATRAVADKSGIRRDDRRERRPGRLALEVVQHGMSLTTRAGSVRGMHFQRDPHAEVKLIRCLSGAIHDVLIDLRPSSPTYL
ncbi:MAG: dTDP-4-dehydrorhamnose 3,5-epimerase family protein, partial [Hyphomicrobiaceae bacterium]